MGRGLSVNVYISRYLTWDRREDDHYSFLEGHEKVLKIKSEFFCRFGFFFLDLLIYDQSELNLGVIFLVVAKVIVFVVVVEGQS